MRRRTPAARFTSPWTTTCRETPNPTSTRATDYGQIVEARRLGHPPVGLQLRPLDPRGSGEARAFVRRHRESGLGLP